MDMDERVKNIVAEVLELQNGTIASEAKLGEDLNADSLHIVELVMALEKAFDIEISEMTAKSLVSVQDVVEYVTRYYKISPKVIH